MIEVNKIYHGNCLDVLKTFEDNCIDSCVTDPPYGISFMNKHWDYEIPSVEIWEEVFRVLKPGGHLLCACGTRTQHRMAVNIENAGFEIRDVITWHYGSGFPKSLDISKAIDKQAGEVREVVGQKYNKGRANGNIACEGLNTETKFDPVTEPFTDAAKQWEGWGTALKPATEFWTLARKPLSENTVAENVLKYGTGGINIDGSRIESGDSLGRLNVTSPFGNSLTFSGGAAKARLEDNSTQGRFPANVIFDEFTGKILDEQSGSSVSSGGSGEKSMGALGKNGKYGQWALDRLADNSGGLGDEGGASRFFYCPKADSLERNKGLKDFEKKQSGFISNTSGQHLTRRDGGAPDPKANNHPTVKPIDLMRYLVKLITPKHGICVDPFCGSGTTLIGCKLELIKYIGVDTNEEYCKIAEARVAAWNPEKYIEQTLF